MNYSIDQLKQEINNITAQLKTCDRADWVTLKTKQKELLDTLHAKKFKTRIKSKYGKAKAAAKEKADVKPLERVREIIKEIKVPVEIIKEVPIEVEVIREVIKEVPVNTGGAIPDKLNTDEYESFINQILTTYIKSVSKIELGSKVRTIDGEGIVKYFYIDHVSLLNKQSDGVYAKVKKITNAGKESKRFMGKSRGYSLNAMTLIV